MNEKKILWLRKGGFEETNRTSHLGFDSYNFCRAFHGGSSEKKSKFYHLSVQRYLQNKRDFFETLIFQKTCFAFFQGRKSETPGLQRTRCTPKQYRRFACKFFSDFNASGSQCFGTVIGIQSV